MAVVTRYFSDSGAGAADGTTWADRAALLSAGSFSTVITGFAFNGSDSMLAYVEGAKTYTITNDLASGDFANPPTVANPLVFHGCNSSGAALSVPDEDWTSDQPAWTDTTLPVFATTTNIQTINVTLGTVLCRLIKFTASGRNFETLTGANLDWCIATNSAAATNVAIMITGAATNCVLKCTGATYAYIARVSSDQPSHFNTRFEGVAGSSGDRHGVIVVGNGTVSLDLCTIIGNGGNGVHYSSGSATQRGTISRCTIANNGAKGVLLNSTASQTENWVITGCCITGHGTNGIDAGAARVVCTHNRLRDNGTNFANFGNWPTDFNYTTDAADADEYVNTATGDYRIDFTAAIAEMGYGVSEAKPTAEEVGAAIWNDTYSPNRTLT